MTDHVAIRRSFWSFFFASVTASVVVNVNSMLVGVVVGHAIGPDAVSVVNLAVPALTLVTLVPTFLVLGANLLASKAVGTGERAEVRRLFTACLVAAVTLTGVGVAVGLACRESVVRLLTGDARLLPLMREYLPVALLSCFGTIAYLGFTTFAKVVGHPRMVVAAAVAEFGACLTATVLLVGVLGLGVRSAGWAMLLGGLVSTLPVCRLFRTERSVFGFVRMSPVRCLASACRCLTLGVPLGVGTLVLAVFVLCLNTFAQRCGGADAAFVVSIALQLMMMSMLVLQGADAAVMNVGAPLWSRSDFDGYRSLLRHVFGVLCTVLVVVTLVVESFPGALAGLFGADATLAGIAVGPLREISLAICPLGVILLLVGVYTLEGHGAAALVMQLGMFAMMLVPVWAACAHAPRLFWLALPAGLFALLAMTFLWSALTACRSGGLHPLTLAPLADRPDSISIHNKKDTVQEITE